MSVGIEGSPYDAAISAELVKIHACGEGLYSSALVIVNGQIAYTTRVTGSGSGGTDTFLQLSQYTKGTDEYNEAKLSQTDSEVATLQDVWDMLSEGGVQGLPESVTIVLVCNIGPCNPCKKRLAAFRDKVVQLFPQAAVSVEVIYDQEGRSEFNTQRRGLPTTYGYPDLPGDDQLSDGTLVWRRKV
jgi:hypothetical protein